MRVTDWIESEIFVAVHVIVVVPDYIERDFGLSVILHDVFHDGEIPVAPSALVKPYNFQFFTCKIFVFWLLTFQEMNIHPMIGNNYWLGALGILFPLSKCHNCAYKLLFN